MRGQCQDKHTRLQFAHNHCHLREGVASKWGTYTRPRLTIRRAPIGQTRVRAQGSGRTRQDYYRICGFHSSGLLVMLEWLWLHIVPALCHRVYYIVWAVSADGKAPHTRLLHAVCSILPFADSCAVLRTYMTQRLLSAFS